MDREFWISRWEQGRIGFHRDGVHPLLRRFWPDVPVEPSRRTLVPLCGKTEDMRWLIERGLEVVGVELSEIPPMAFAREQGFTLIRSEEPPFSVFRGRKITFYIGDFFNFTSAVSGRFELFYDRAALIALPPEMRLAYAQQLQSLILEEGEGLLISLEYDSDQMEGPPFSVTESEIIRLFSEFRCEKLLESDCLKDEPRFQERGVRWMNEVVYRLKRSPR